MRIGAAAKALRLELNETRTYLAARAGVPVPTLRRFEETGLAPVLTVIRIAVALGCADRLEHIFAPPPALPDSLDALIRQETRPKRRRASRR